MLDVPFHAQRSLADECAPDVDGATWTERCCAIACATMVLNHYQRRARMVDVLSRALARSAYAPDTGWSHSALVDVLQSYGLLTYRRNWRLLDGHEVPYLAGRPRTPATEAELRLVKQQMIDEGLWRIRDLVRSGPVITSVYRPWGDRTGMGHQIVLLGTEGERLYYHDPAEASGAFRSVAARTFTDGWKGLAIVATEPGPAGGPQPQ
jgi:hypothetical protein